MNIIEFNKLVSHINNTNTYSHDKYDLIKQLFTYNETDPLYEPTKLLILEILMKYKK